MSLNKLGSGKIVLLVAGGMLLPGVAFGQTSNDFQARLADLLRQLQTLQSQMNQAPPAATPAGGGSGSECAAFTRNLRSGFSGADVGMLHKLLAREGFSIPADEQSRQEFGKGTALATTGFQERYRNEILVPAGLAAGNGFVGQGTRAKFMRLYPCAKPSSSAVPAPLPSPASVPASGTLTLTLATSSPAAQTLLPGSSAVRAGTFRLATGASEVKVKSLTVTVGLGMPGICELRNLRLMDGSTQVSGTLQPNSFCSVTFVNVSIAVTATSSKDIALYGDLSATNPAGQRYQAALQAVSADSASVQVSGLPVLANPITVGGNSAAGAAVPGTTNTGSGNATTTVLAVKSLVVARAASSALGGTIPRQAVLDAVTFQMTASAPVATDNIIVNSLVFRRTPAPAGGCDLSSASLVRASTGQVLATGNFDSSCETVFRNLNLYIAPATTETLLFRANAANAAAGSLSVQLTAMDSNALVTGLPVSGNSFIFARSDQDAQMASALHSLRSLLEALSGALR